MKRLAAVFCAVFVLALCLGAAASVSVAGQKELPRLHGEIQLGSREEAAGVTLTQDVVLEGHMEWSFSYDAATGRDDASTRWSMAELYEPRQRSEPYVGASLESYSMGGSWSGPSDRFDLAGLDVFDDGALEEILREAASNAAGSGRWSGSVRLNDYTDRLYFEANSYAVLDAATGEYPDWLPESFAVPLDEEVTLQVELYITDDGGSYEVFPSEGPFYQSLSDSVYASDGNLYLLLSTLEYDQAGGCAAADSSLVPGGAWGLYRIPASAPEASEGRYGYTSAGCSADFGSAENVYPLEAEVQAVCLEESASGRELLLFTVEDGALRLTVYPLYGGEGVQSTTVLSAEEAARLEMDLEWMCGHGAVEVLEDAVLLDSEEHIAAVEFEDGRAVGTAALYSRPEYPEHVARGGEEWTDVYESRYAYEGGRLYVLDKISYYAEGSWYMEALRLTAYRGGECVYSEWMENGLGSGSFYSGINMDDIRLEVSG